MNNRPNPRGHDGPAALSLDMKQFTRSIAQMRPGRLKIERLVAGLVVQRFWATRHIHLHKLHDAIHPSRRLVCLEGAEECDDDLGAGAMDFAASDLHDLADRDRLIATDVEDSLEDEIGVQSGGSKGGGIGRFEGE